MPRDKFQAARRRADLRARAIAFKGGKCQICGYARCAAAMDFHHLDPLSKDFTISSRLTSWSIAIEDELKKTILICSNCHREVHDGWHPSFIVHEDANRGWVDSDEDLDLD